MARESGQHPHADVLTVLVITQEEQPGLTFDALARATVQAVDGKAGESNRLHHGTDRDRLAAANRRVQQRQLVWPKLRV